MNKKENIVENFDLVEIETYYGKKVKRHINVKNRPNDREYLGMKVGSWFDDRCGRLQRIVGIVKNDPYVGLSTIVPGLAKDNYNCGYGKPRKW